MAVQVLTLPEIEEVSLVDKAANKWKFFFVKRDEGSEEFELEKGDTSISIKSDGTVDGTEVSVNGRAVSNLVDFTFGFYVDPGWPGDKPQPVAARYTVKAKGQSSGGFKSTRTYTLAKAAKDAPDNDQGQHSNLQKSLEVLEQYEDAFPASVKEALQGIVAAAKDNENTEIVKEEQTMVEEQPKTTEAQEKETKTTEAKTTETAEVKAPVMDVGAIAAQLAELQKPMLQEMVDGAVAAAVKVNAPKEEEPISIKPSELAEMVSEEVDAATD